MDSSIKYLRDIIRDDLSDVVDINRQRTAITLRANMITRRFRLCTDKVKSILFPTYCMYLYIAELWTKYTQNAVNFTSRVVLSPSLHIYYNSCKIYIFFKKMQDHRRPNYPNQKLCKILMLSNFVYYSLSCVLLQSHCQPLPIAE